MLASAIKDMQSLLQEQNIKINETVILTGIPAQKIIGLCKNKRNRFNRTWFKK